MQYLLTAEELAGLQERAKRGDKAPDEKALQSLCSLVADHAPVEDGWKAGTPWGCILTRKDKHGWYCDECPAQDVCPHPYKRWSK